VDPFTLTEEQEDLRQVVRTLAEERIAPHAAAVDREARFPKEANDALIAAGFHAAHVPVEFGGEGADALAVCLIIEEVARVCGASSLIPAVNKLGSLPVILAGTTDQQERFLRPLARGEAMFSYCLSETDAGSDAVALRTRATPDGDGWRLSGSKKWITNAGESRYYTVMATRDPSLRSRGISAFIVDREDPGVSFGALEHKLGIRGSPTREVYFDDVPLTADRLLGPPDTGFALAMRVLDHTRITIAAQAIGLAQGALDAATAHLRLRTQFGRPLAEFQGLQFMVADMGMQLEAARMLTYAAACRSERQAGDLTWFGAASKCYASDVAMRVTTDAVQLLGGYGYTSDFPVERMMRDAKITQIYEGTNQIQRIVMARHLLAG